MKRFYFVRHGLSEANKAGVFGGKTETPLSEEGKAQAAVAGRAAKKLTIDLIVASPLIRAHDTAKIVANEIGFPQNNIITNELLVERKYGKAKPTVGNPRMIDFSKVEGAETDEMLFDRAQKIVDWLESLEPDNILVVSHGGVGRAIRKVIKTDSDFHEAIPNAEIVCWIED